MRPLFVRPVNALLLEYMKQQASNPAMIGLPPHERTERLESAFRALNDRELDELRRQVPPPEKLSPWQIFCLNNEHIARRLPAEKRARILNMAWDMRPLSP